MGYLGHVFGRVDDPQRYNFGPNVEYLNVDTKPMVGYDIPEISNMIELVADVKMLRVPSSPQSRAAFDSIVEHVENMLKLYAYIVNGGHAHLGVTTLKMNRCYASVAHQVKLLKDIYVRAASLKRVTLPCDDICADLISACDNILQNTLQVDRTSFYTALGGDSSNPPHLP